MADEGTFATTAEIQYKCGAGANSTYYAEAYLNVYIKQAESYINSVTRFNWHDAFVALNTDVKHLLKEAASNLAAGYAISQDMSGFFSLAEAQTLLNYLWDRAEKCIELLEDQKVKDFVENA